MYYKYLINYLILTEEKNRVGTLMYEKVVVEVSHQTTGGQVDSLIPR